MVSGNGADAIEQALERLEQLEQAELARVEAELIQARVDLEVARRLAELQSAPRRSQMSPLEKSQYIRARGLEAYNALPWN